MYLRLSNGRRIWYELLGAPEAPIVCLNHSLTADSGMWAEQVPYLLEADYRVLRLDIRGHGGSDPAKGAYTLEELADDVVAVLKALELPAVHYIGLSIGGMFGQALALNFPHLLHSLMLCDTMVASTTGAEAMWNERIQLARTANSLEPLAEATLNRWFSTNFQSRSRIRCQQIYESILATSLDGFEGCVRAIQRFDFSHQLSTLNIPTLVVCGSDDPGTPPEENRRLATLIPNADYKELKECKHLPNIEKPDEFNRIMINWLNSNR